MANLLGAFPVQEQQRPGAITSVLTASGILKTASCQSLGQHGYINRAEALKLKSVFEKYASLEIEGVEYFYLNRSSIHLNFQKS